MVDKLCTKAARAQADSAEDELYQYSLPQPLSPEQRGELITAQAADEGLQQVLRMPGVGSMVASCTTYESRLEEDPAAKLSKVGNMERYGCHSCVNA